MQTANVIDDIKIIMQEEDTNSKLQT